jgi:protein phosphatase
VLDAWQNTPQNIEMRLEIKAVTDVGLKRASNQDSLLVNEELKLFAVADGMGGHMGGEVASAIAVQTIEEVVKKALSSETRIYPHELIARAYREANFRIYKRSQENGGALKGMGTTLVLALFYGGSVYIGNVGDSRAYLFRTPRLWQLTEDHSLINEHIRAGLLLEADIPKFMAKNVITRSVGFEPDVACDIIERKIQKDDVFLICSDGYSGLVADSRTSDLLLLVSSEDAVPRCVFEAKQNGGDDNLTLITIRVKEV